MYPVTIVGTGPRDPDLLTVKAYRYIAVVEDQAILTTTLGTT